MRKIILVVGLFLVTTALWAQRTENWCATDSVYFQALKENPEALKEAERKIDEAAYAYSQMASKTDDGRQFYIPVVFHYFHPSSENANLTKYFGEEDANAVIERMNQDYNRRNEDTTQGPDQPEYMGFHRGNAHITFVRAQFDPHGNPSNGINYIETELTNASKRTNDQVLKYMSYWPSDMYLNFWIVKSLSSGPSGVLAYSTLPDLTAAGASPKGEDGVIGLWEVFKANPPVGSKEKAFYRHTLSHEAGHWLGLRHPFQTDGSVTNAFGNPSGCSILDCHFGGDKICDIPQSDTIYRECDVVNTCPNDPRNDASHNIMDYRYCPYAFSRDQVQRMRSTLVGLRQSVVSWENLQATGVNQVVAAEADKSVNVYPNPFSDKIVVEVDAQHESTACIEIKDLLGRTAYKDCRKKLLQGSNKIEISASQMNLSEGVYIIQIQFENYTVVKKVQYSPNGSSY
ncbi:T9SS type A sorting domain-containing protein [bacterium]|nr:T9SS type A sorting domain-containing protein [bacterium]